MMKVVWSPHAEETLFAVLEQIESNWGFNIAADFHDEVINIIKLIADNPLMYKESPIKHARQAVISSQTSMLYEVRKDYILILFFFDNRQQPFL